MARMCEQFCPVNSVRQEVPTEYSECRENRINCDNYNCNHNCIRQVHSAIKQDMEEFKSACPSKKEKLRKKCTESKLEKDEDIGPPCIEKRPYMLPSQICPKTVSCCYIKMQDPYAPCCCETKPQPPPCPPKYRRPPRKPTCGCDLCEKNVESKCCSSSVTSHGSR